MKEKLTTILFYIGIGLFLYLNILTIPAIWDYIKALGDIILDNKIIASTCLLSQLTYIVLKIKE